MAFCLNARAERAAIGQHAALSVCAAYGDMLLRGCVLDLKVRF